MSTVVFYIALYIAFELFEIWWQKAPTLYGVLENIYKYYQKSIFVLLLIHPTFYLLVYLMMISGYDLYLQIALGLKLSDIALKILFVQKVFIKQEIDAEFKMMLGMRMEWYMLYLGVIFYPVMIYLGLS
ncbi:hypothetical protein MNB_SM-7-1064 [hydrothermal vent metagenome]|uniref:Uncharacterized protein n=1 Tax=hydrothermal vent metagenome TaxID=652676 RepID=A0A1W1B9Z3_9ZZZZ